MRNERDEHVRDMTSPYCIGHLQRGGTQLPSEPSMFFTMEGLSFDLAPGASVDLSVVLSTCRPQQLQPGTYLLKARSIDLDLEAPAIELVVV